MCGCGWIFREWEEAFKNTRMGNYTITAITLLREQI